MLRSAPIRAYIPASNMTRTRKFYEEIVGVQPKEEYAGGVYLNLASRMKLTGMNQLWTADITYIRLKKEFVFLAVILDACSRKVVGWSLDRTFASRLRIAALEQAIAERQPAPDLVHHSDRGVQYASLLTLCPVS